MPHEPPPPHADGRNTLLLASVESSVAALGDEHFLPAVDVDGDIARGGQFRLRKEKQPHENQGYHQKGNDRYDNC